MSRGVPLLACCLAAAACSADGPRARQQEELSFLRLAENAPPLSSTQVSFWAVRDDNREGRLWFLLNGGADSTEFLRFRVDNESLLRYPDGRQFAEDDSVRITITVVDLQRLIFRFEPEGLVFSSSRPAELELDFSYADDDLDNDGSVDADDLRIRQTLSWWRQEEVGLPWLRQASFVFDAIDEIEADVFGFTNYAVAY